MRLFLGGRRRIALAECWRHLVSHLRTPIVAALAGLTLVMGTSSAQDLLLTTSDPGIEAAEPLAAEPLPPIEAIEPVGTDSLLLDGNAVAPESAVAPMALTAGATEDGPEAARPAKFVELDAPHSGAFTRSFPVEVPPFFEITPKLSLDYSSANTRLTVRDGFSPLGVGWRLSGGSVIERTTRVTGTPTFVDTADTFVLDGNPLIPCGTISSPSCAAGGTHATRFETYERIQKVAADNSWVVTGRGGTRFTYRPLGNWNSSSGQPANVVTKFRWLLAAVTDTDGNTVNYSYNCASLPVCYVSQIAYGPNTITLNWETRPDTFSFATGLSVSPVVDRRIKSIVVSQSAAPIRAYALSYTTSPDTRRSLLASITQYGRDVTVNPSTGAVTGGTSLPAEEFTYGTMASWRSASRIQNLLLTPNSNVETSPYGTNDEPQSKLVTDGLNADANYVFGDFDGDNKTDLLWMSPSLCQATFYKSGQWSGSSSGPTGGLAVSAPSAATAHPLCKPASDWYVGDFNGDGRDDLAIATTRSNVTTSFKPAGYADNDAVVAVMLLKEGSTPGSLKVAGSIVEPIGDAGGGIYAGLRSASQSAKMIVGDFNGDGKDDFYRGLVYLSNGTEFSRHGWTDRQWGRPGDFNGDGMTDLFVLDGTDGTASYLLLSTGTSFSKKPMTLTFTDRLDQLWPEFEGSGGAYSGPAFLGGWEFSDLNGDGLTDALQTRVILADDSTRLYKYLATGSGFIKSVEYSALAGTTLVDDWVFDLYDLNGDGLAEYLRESSDGTDKVANHVGDGYRKMYYQPDTDSLYGNFPADFNGDGKLDLRYVMDDSPAGCSECIAARSDSVVPDMMHTHSMSTGGSIDITYLPSTYWAHGYLPTVLQVVSKIVTHDGRGAIATVKYGYDGGAYDVVERKFLGFKTVTTKLPCEACEAGEASCPWVTTYFSQHPAAVGAIKRLEIYDGAGTLRRKVTNTYAISVAAPFTVQKASEQVDDYLVGGTSTTNRNWAYDTYGNVITETDLGVASSTLDDVTTRTYFWPNTTGYLVNFPGAVDVRDAAGTVLRNTMILYDGSQALGTPPAKGHPTVTLAWLNPGGSWLGTGYLYDSFGQLTAQTDPLGHRTDIFYDATHQFVTETRDPLYANYGDARHKITAVWNTACGVPTSSTGLNGQTTVYQYDTFCRPTVTSFPGGDYEKVYYYNLGDAELQRIDTVRPAANGVTEIVTSSYFDGLGREYKSARSDVGPRVVVRTEYAKRGSVLSQSLPLFEGGTLYWTKTEVDVLGRPARTTLPDGNAITRTYSVPLVAPGVVTINTTDPRGKVSGVVRDVGGRDLQRLGNGLVPMTTFVYDALGQHTDTIDANGNRWKHVFDTLGRRISSADPDLGRWTYVYDNGGNLLRQTDAKGQITALNYDAIDRVLTKTTAQGQPHQEVTTNTYDQVRAGYANVGTLTTAANANATIAYDYDVGGRLVKQATTVDAQTHVITSAFDAGGRLLSRTYPDGTSSGTFTYDAAGRQYGLAGAIVSTAYNSSGQVTSIAYANGVTTSYGYSATRGWLNSVVTTKGGTTLAQFTYVRDPAGFITSVAGLRANESWTYTYGAQDRLYTATNVNTPTLNRTYYYDAGGNLNYNSGLGNYTYPPQGPTSVRPHAVTSAGSSSFTYDANGNQLTRSVNGTVDRSIAYDGENRPVLVAVNGNAVTYRYGPDGARLKKIVGANTTLYLGDDIERDPTGAFVIYLTPDVKRIAGALHYLHRDSQSSVRAITDAAGTLTRASAYEPYGVQLETAINPLTPVESKGYIGERTDPETGLTYLHARYYDTALGRFLQPDWWSEADPGVGTNRYLYALGDPINRSDPNGHIVSDFWLQTMGMTDQLEDRQAARAQAALQSNQSTEQRVLVAGAILRPGVGLGGPLTPLSPEGQDATAKALQLGVGAIGDGVVWVIKGYLMSQGMGPMLANETAGGPIPNRGVSPPHGGPDHDAAVDEKIDQVTELGATNIRKNQVQVDVDGNKVGANRPDLQYDLDGKHHNWEVDNDSKRSLNHGDRIRANDPNAVCTLTMLGGC